MTAPERIMSHDEALSSLLSFLFSGSIGPSKGKGVSYSLFKATDESFSWIAALEEMQTTGQPVDRYRVDIDRITRKIQAPVPIKLSKSELEEAVLAATGHHLQTFSSIQYIVRLRHHGDVTSMNLLMQFISSNTERNILPLPSVYPIPGEYERQIQKGMGRQIARLVPGPLANTLYPGFSHNEKLAFVRNMAKAFQAIWGIPLPEGHLIGELCAYQAEDCIALNIGPERHYSLGGPFSSVREYLRAYIRSSLEAFKNQQGIDEYKQQFLQPVTDFVERGMHNIPVIVEEVPVVAMHSDMGPHNVILSPENPTKIAAIIDWEFVASAPYPSLYRIIETLFRRSAPNGFGAEYAQADELRDAFWAAIPEWGAWNKRESTKIFLEWFRFGLFMKAEWRPGDLDEEEKNRYWSENVRVVEGMLAKYGPI